MFTHFLVPIPEGLAQITEYPVSMSLDNSRIPQFEEKAEAAREDYRQAMKKVVSCVYRELHNEDMVRPHEERLCQNQALAIVQRYLVERFHEKYHIDLLHPARSQRCLQFFDIPEKGEAMEGNCVIVERYKLALRTAVFSANVSKLERFVYDHFCLPQRTIVAVTHSAFRTR